MTFPQYSSCRNSPTEFLFPLSSLNLLSSHNCIYQHLSSRFSGQSILFLPDSKFLRVRTIRSSVLTLQSNMLLCVSGWGLCQVFYLRNLQGEAQRQEPTAGDNLLYPRRRQQSPNPAQGFQPERMEEEDRHGIMLAYTGVCL